MRNDHHHRDISAAGPDRPGTAGSRVRQLHRARASTGIARKLCACPGEVPCRLVNGVLTSPNLVPGPAVVQVGNETYDIEIPDSAAPVQLWPLIDAGMPPPVNVPGFVRNAGGIARITRVTRDEYAALTNPDPETLYIVFEN